MAAIALPSADAIVRRIANRPTARILIGLFALGWSVAAVSFWQVRAYEAFLGTFWPLWFAVTAATCWAFLVRPYSHIWHRISGAMSFTGLLSRGGGHLLNLIEHRDSAATSPWYAVLGMVIFPLFALSLLFVWDVGFGEVSCRYRGMRRGDGSPVRS